MEDLIIGKRELSPDAASVTILPDHLLRECYLPLKNDILFQTATVTFGTVQWANGLDLDPEWLYKDSVPVQ